MKGKHILSKSSFIKGIQCEKQLYLYKYHYDWMDEVSASQQEIFDRGQRAFVKEELKRLTKDIVPGQ